MLPCRRNSYSKGNLSKGDQHEGAPEAAAGRLPTATETGAAALRPLRRLAALQRHRLRAPAATRAAVSGP